MFQASSLMKFSSIYIIRVGICILVVLEGILDHCDEDNNQELAAIEADKQRLLDKVKNFLLFLTGIYLHTR